MFIIEQIKAGHLEARKKRDQPAAAFLSLLLSECQKPGKNENRESTDDEAIKVLNKFKTNAELNLHHTPANQIEMIALIYSEMTLVNKFLPALPPQLGAQELAQVMTAIIVEVGANKGLVMKTLKERYAGQYAGSQAARVYDQTAK